VPKEGWLERQFARAEKDLAEWPELRKKASELADERGIDRDQPASASESRKSGGVVKLY